jgi:multidrug transporter EmrE-like cation transporter
VAIGGRGCRICTRVRHARTGAQTRPAVGVAYAIWAAFGIALVATIGVVFFQEQITLAMVTGLAMVIGGVVLLEVGRVH